MTTDIRFVDAGKVYTADEVASLLRRMPVTVRRWIRSGVLPALPRPTPKAPHRISGAAVLALLGSVGGVAVEAETQAERQKRSDAAFAEAMAL